MTQAVIQSKLNQLQIELKLLRSFVIGIIGKDPEGEYRPEFVKKMLKITREKPIHTFTSKKEFLAHLHGKSEK